MAEPTHPETTDDHSERPDPAARTGPPRWVKVFGIIGLAVALLVVVLLVFGGGPGNHGPGRHTSSGRNPAADSSFSGSEPEGTRGHAPAAGGHIP